MTARGIMLHFQDPLCMPGTGEGAGDRLLRTCGVGGSEAEGYFLKRRVPVEVAETAGLRFDPDFAGRAAVVVPMRDRDGRVTGLHGRYLHVTRGQNKMLTFGTGGVIEVLDGVEAKEPVLVEGLFDALSLAACGWPCVATIGRWAPWLAEAWAGRTVWLAFDAGRPGEAEVVRYSQRISGSTFRRLLPPPRCKDWNTALVKRGRVTVSRWLRDSMSRGWGE